MARFLFPLLACILFAANLSGCMSDSTAETSNDVPFSVIAEGSFSGITSQRFEVIADPSTFAELWLAHGSIFSPEPAQPDFDFSREMVVAVFLGQQSSGGYDIRIAEAKDREDSIEVNVRAVLPVAGCAVSGSFSQPFRMVTLPLSSKVVAFNTVVERVSCP